MPIEYLPSCQTFFLHAGDSSYAFKIDRRGKLVHLYWGPRIAAQNLDYTLTNRARGFTCTADPRDPSASLDNLPQEFPAYGNSDFRSPMIEVQRPLDGMRVMDFCYTGHVIVSGKPPLPGLPAAYVNDSGEAQALTVTLADALTGLCAELSYSVFERVAVITRSVRLHNGGAHPLTVSRLLSCSVDFSAAFADYQFLHLSGAWARERDLHCRPLRPGMQSVESRRGASSHQHNPFFIVSDLGDSEEHGRAYGFNLIYSGNFFAGVEVNYDGNPRAQIGVNPFDFSWSLTPGASFQSPEAVLVFSNHGLGQLSRELHRFYRRNLCRGAWRDRQRPVLLNNWEATYFDFDAAKLERLAETAAGLGVEMFVLDDGWFGRRNDDRTSLGDWTVDRKKLPAGLAELAGNINRQGLQFGLWFEPEMVSPDSDFYRAHPDWCLHVADRQRTEGRNQLALDLSRPEVCDAVYEAVAKILRSAPVAYVKWDMNRHLTEIGSAALPPERQRETAHRYLLGLYAMMEKFVTEFPGILFEGCSGGGGRFDPGILHYMPQIWTSDNSDAISRLRIQYGTSLAYPLSVMAAHVSAVPNHQVGRVTPLLTRGHVAFTGAFGYELDLAKLSELELAEIKRQIATYKQFRQLLADGDLYRLKSPFRGQSCAWMVVAENQSEALVTHAHILAEPNPADTWLSLRGLNPKKNYAITGTDRALPGDALMSIGILVPPADADFSSAQWHLKICE